MCGIAGLYHLTANPLDINDQKMVRDMTGLLRHRGPDHQGIWQDKDVPVTLGHQRLSIIDLSYHGYQPMVSHSGRYVLSYNGEIYNYHEIAQSLKNEKIHFNGRSDTEVLLAAIDVWGLAKTLQKINGMFAFALWDKHTKKLSLARDRFGEKPLYIGWLDGQHLVFSSECRALRCLEPFQHKIDTNAVFQYMRYGYIPAPQCIYDGIIQIPPGCLTTLDMNHIQPNEDLLSLTRPYWNIGEITNVSKDHFKTQHSKSLQDEHVFEHIQSLLKHAVQTRMIADVPLGSFLSGGLDSTLVTALMCENTDSPINTFTIGFHEAEYNEAHHAKQIAKHLGTNHHELMLSGQDARDIIPTLTDIYDEPFADPSQIPTSLICRFAKDKITVALTGDGGDEIFGGYQRHISGPPLWNKLSYMPYGLRCLLAKTIKNTPDYILAFINPGYPEWQDRLIKLQNALRSPDFNSFSHSFVMQWGNPNIICQKGQDQSIPLTQDHWYPSVLSNLETFMFKDILHYLPNNILTKIDRAAMSVSLETRAPLIDHRLYEYMAGLPDNFKVRQGQGKYLLHHILKDKLPSHLYERPKHGFSVPIREWLRGPLQDWAQSLIEKDDDYLNQKTLMDQWTSFCSGQDDNYNRIWTALMFRQWLANGQTS